MSSNVVSDRILDSFASKLANAVSLDDHTLVRLVTSHTDRSFEVRGGEGTVAFDAHLSQSANGFWGLTSAKAIELFESGRQHLVLLRSEDRGYFASAVALKRLIPKFSRAEDTQAIKINEGQIKALPRFRTIDDLWELLKAKMVPPAT